jgi:hypothetical protein
LETLTPCWPTLHRSLISWEMHTTGSVIHSLFPRLNREIGPAFFPQLREVSFPFHGLHDQHFSQHLVPHFLWHTSAVTKLVLCENGLSRESMPDLANVIYLMLSLKVVDLSRNPIGNVGFAILVDALSAVHALEEINLGWCELDIMVAPQLIDLLGTCSTSLRRLQLDDFSSGELQETRLRELCAALRDCSVLCFFQCGRKLAAQSYKLWELQVFAAEFFSRSTSLSALGTAARVEVDWSQAVWVRRNFSWLIRSPDELFFWPQDMATWDSGLRTDRPTGYLRSWDELNAQIQSRKLEQPAQSIKE